jgi:hypothetical protein
MQMKISSLGHWAEREFRKLGPWWDRIFEVVHFGTNYKSWPRLVHFGIYILASLYSVVLGLPLTQGALRRLVSESCALMNVSWLQSGSQRMYHRESQ